MRCIFRTHADHKILEVELTHGGKIDVSCFEVGQDEEPNKQAAVTISIVEARAMAAQITASLEHLEEEDD
jgi:hypothetical protein